MVERGPTDVHVLALEIRENFNNIYHRQLVGSLSQAVVSCALHRSRMGFDFFYFIFIKQNRHAANTFSCRSFQK